MKVLGLITARAGSKGVPGKNIRPLAGKPLLAWTCAAAMEARSLSRVIISTDGEEIAAVARENGVEVPFLRPPELAKDESLVIDAVLHALDTIGGTYDAVVLLQPTSPFRRAEHIDAAVELMKPGVDTVVSIVEVPHQYSPYRLMSVKDGRLTDFIEGPLPFDRYRRQELPRVFARNGPAVLVTRVDTIQKRSFYGPVTVPYLMTDEDSIDIDTPNDFRFAEWLVSQR